MNNNSLHISIASFPTVTSTPAGEVKLIGGDFHHDVFLTPRKARILAQALNVMASAAETRVKCEMLPNYAEENA